MFTLRQARDGYAHCQKQIVECDTEIAELLAPIEPKTDRDQKPLPPDRKKRRTRSHRNALGEGFDMRNELYRRFGVDVLQIPGLERSGLSLLTELGPDLSRFPTAGHFISWLGLCPDNDKSGRRWWRASRDTNNRAGQTFRQCAHSLHRSQSQLGAYLRRMKGKLGPQGATMATARKVAAILYAMVTQQVEYDESIWATLDVNRQARLEAILKRQAARHGFTLVPKASPAPSEHDQQR